MGDAWPGAQQGTWPWDLWSMPLLPHLSVRSAPALHHGNVPFIAVCAGQQLGQPSAVDEPSAATRRAVLDNQQIMFTGSTDALQLLQHALSAGSQAVQPAME